MSRNLNDNVSSCGDGDCATTLQSNSETTETTIHEEANVNDGGTVSHQKAYTESNSSHSNDKYALTVPTYCKILFLVSVAMMFFMFTMG